MNAYTLTSQRIKGEIELQYTEGVLNCISMPFKDQLNAKQFDALVREVKQYEADLPQLAGLGLTITPAMPANKKIDLFCQVYEAEKGMKYKVTIKDSGKIKHVKIDRALLTIYFKSVNSLFKGKHSISNLVNHYNELLFEAKTGASSKHPNTWSKVYEDKLSDAGRKEYWAHLRSLGLRPVRDRVQNVTDWIPVQPNDIQK